VPNTPEAYTHRIGRTGRAEREGQACTFVTAGDRTMVHAIERQIGRDIRIGEVAGFGAPFRLTHSAPPRSRPSRAGRQGAARHASRPGTGKPRRSRSGGRRARASAS
jgi:ATP-dependent RNA helicase RhlE